MYSQFHTYLDSDTMRSENKDLYITDYIRKEKRETYDKAYDSLTCHDIWFYSVKQMLFFHVGYKLIKSLKNWL